jgi:hypothetical protein
MIWGRHLSQTMEGQEASLLGSGLGSRGNDECNLKVNNPEEIQTTSENPQFRPLRNWQN